eukprot:1160944-Pelagomonas_calceolata.AAC.2
MSYAIAEARRAPPAAGLGCLMPYKLGGHLQLLALHALCLMSYAIAEARRAPAAAGLGCLMSCALCHCRSKANTFTWHQSLMPCLVLYATAEAKRAHPNAGLGCLMPHDLRHSQKQKLRRRALGQLLSRNLMVLVEPAAYIAQAMVE